MTVIRGRRSKRESNDRAKSGREVRVATKQARVRSGPSRSSGLICKILPIAPSTCYEPIHEGNVIRCAPRWNVNPIRREV